MVTCPDCGREFRTEQGLSGHVRWKHKRPGKMRWIPGPGSNLITEAEFPKVLIDALQSNQDMHDSLYKFIISTTAGLRDLAELNHKHCDDNDKDIEELTAKLAELAQMLLRHIKEADKQFAELTAIAQDLKDLVAAGQYEKEKARA